MQKNTSLNMSKQNIGDAALVFIRELDKFDITGDRSELINGLRDQCLTRMYDSATHVEKARRSALEILIDRIPKMSDNMLIRTIETLTEIAEVDISSTFGSREVKR